MYICMIMTKTFSLFVESKSLTHLHVVLSLQVPEECLHVLQGFSGVFALGSEITCLIT